MSIAICIIIIGVIIMDKLDATEYATLVTGVLDNTDLIAEVFEYYKNHPLLVYTENQFRSKLGESLLKFPVLVRDGKMPWSKKTSLKWIAEQFEVDEIDLRYLIAKNPTLKQIYAWMDDIDWNALAYNKNKARPNIPKNWKKKTKGV